MPSAFTRTAWRVCLPTARLGRRQAPDAQAISGRHPADWCRTGNGGWITRCYQWAGGTGLIGAPGYENASEMIWKFFKDQSGL